MKVNVIEKGKSVLTQLVHTYVTVNLVLDLTILVSLNSPTHYLPPVKVTFCNSLKSRDVTWNHVKPFTANYSMFRPQDGTVFLNIVLVLFGTRSCLCSLLFFFRIYFLCSFYVRYYVCYVYLTVVQVTVLILTNVMKQIHAVQMLFAEILLAIMNATVSKIFTEIFLENASKQSKCFKINLECSK